MKREDIAEILSRTDSRFIEEAAAPTKKKSRVLRYMSIAACLALAVLAVIAISRNDMVTPPVEPDGQTTTNESGGGEKVSPEIATEPAAETVTDTASMVLPQWADLAVPMRYSEARLGDITYSTQNKEISADNVFEPLGSTEMEGYDIYTDTRYTVNAELYSIKSISSECAVAVRIDGGESFYVYVNALYEPDTLGDFISDLNLKSTVVFLKAYIDEYEYYDNGSEHRQRVYADFDDSVIWNLLEDALTAKNVEYNHPYDRISIETDLPVLGYENISFCITPDGYIITNILDTQKCFYIGTEKFTQLDGYLKKNVPFKEYNTVYEMNSDGTIPGKGDSGEVQTAPAYNPNENTIADYYVPDSGTAPPYVPEGLIVEETTRS